MNFSGEFRLFPCADPWTRIIRYDVIVTDESDIFHTHA
jgi:hypothetical protein